MKSLLMAFAVLTSLSAHATNAQCKVKEVTDSSVLEESLSVEEYPDISATSDEVHLGSSAYSTSDGDSIVSQPSGDSAVVIQIDAQSGESFLISYAHGIGQSGDGSLLYRGVGGSTFSEIATLSCR